MRFQFFRMSVIEHPVRYKNSKLSVFGQISLHNCVLFWNRLVASPGLVRFHNRAVGAHYHRN